MSRVSSSTETKTWKVWSVPLPATNRDIYDLHAFATKAWETDNPGRGYYDDMVEFVVEGDEGDDQRLVARYLVKE